MNSLYLIMNLVFLGLAIMLDTIVLKTYGIRSVKVWKTIGILLLLTAVFDSIIVRAGIVTYQREHILGWYIGYAPVEDFFYALLAPLIMYSLLTFYARRTRTP